MKLATLKSSAPDGELIVVDQSSQWAVKVNHIAPNLRVALENWSEVAPELQKLSDELNLHPSKNSFPLVVKELHSPLPRSFGWLDGSAFIQHVLLVRKARGAVPPPTLRTDPMMYQGGSDSFLAPTEDIVCLDPQFGLDFEGEVGIITDFVPVGTKAKDALRHIKLIVLINDLTLRNLVPDELAKGFGFLQSKPSSAFSPFALTPDELGPHWRDGRLHLPLYSEYNQKRFGNPEAGEMHFSFPQLIEHAAKTRSLAPGTIIGSGTVSNEDENRGGSCLAEKRMLEKIKTGEFKTPFMQVGDTIKIEMLSPEGKNLFGSILQKVVGKPHV